MRFRWFLLLVFISSATFCDAQSPAQKLQSIIFPSIEFNDAALHEVLDFLQAGSAEISGSPSGGVNFILNGDDELRNLPIALKLQNVSLGQALWFLLEMAKLDIKIDQHAVMLSEAEEWTRRPTKPSAADKAVAQKLREMVVPGVEFSSVPLSDAIDLMRAYSSQLDTSEPAPKKRGINFVYIPDSAAGEEPGITFTLTQVPLMEVLRYTAELSGFEARIEKGVVVIAPKVVASQ
ncbi:hypothetical protein VSU19_17870 [Verrucomicrobiales bacterium BCK34]|nr:hypothetical protein [Verrucomicrobiales bacterium BCK34]